MDNKGKWWKKEWCTTQEERFITLGMDAQIFLRGIWLPKDKNEWHNNSQILLLFFIQWPFIYRRMERFFLTSSKCEWETFIGTSHPFQWSQGEIWGWFWVWGRSPSSQKWLRPDQTHQCVISVSTWVFQLCSSCTVCITHHVSPCRCECATLAKCAWISKTTFT